MAKKKVLIEEQPVETSTSDIEQFQNTLDECPIKVMVLAQGLCQFGIQLVVGFDPAKADPEAYGDVYDKLGFAIADGLRGYAAAVNEKVGN